ncbi:MAG: hypothetical protein WBC69_15455, partial [Geitlerinemataceae cyanobacterium]
TGYSCPEQLVNIVNQFQAGDVLGATAAYTRYLPVLNCEQKYGLALRKEILRQCGAISSSTLRMSGVTINNTVRLELDRVFRQLEICGESVEVTQTQNREEGDDCDEFSVKYKSQ